MCSVGWPETAPRRAHMPSCAGVGGSALTETTPSTIALQRRTRAILVVFVGAGDPVTTGIPERLDRTSPASPAWKPRWRQVASAGGDGFCPVNQEHGTTTDFTKLFAPYRTRVTSTGNYSRRNLACRRWVRTRSSPHRRDGTRWRLVFHLREHEASRPGRWLGPGVASMAAVGSQVAAMYALPAPRSRRSRFPLATVPSRRKPSACRQGARRLRPVTAENEGGGRRFWDTEIKLKSDRAFVNVKPNRHAHQTLKKATDSSSAYPLVGSPRLQKRIAGPPTSLARHSSVTTLPQSRRT
jgi:hypothetical protein